MSLKSFNPTDSNHSLQPASLTINKSLPPLEPYPVPSCFDLASTKVNHLTTPFEISFPIALDFAQTAEPVTKPATLDMKALFRWKQHLVKAGLAALTVSALLYLWRGWSHSDHIRHQLPNLVLRKALLTKILETDHSFVPANDDRLQYVGRWVQTSDKLRRDTSFSGSYIDLTLSNSTTLYISLHNDRSSIQVNSVSTPEQDPRHVSLQPISSKSKAAAPVDVLVRINKSQYIQFPGSGHGLVAVSEQSLDPGVDHHVRVYHMGAQGSDSGVLQLEGFWLSRGGFLRPKTCPRLGLSNEKCNDKSTRDLQHSLHPSKGLNSSKFFKKTLEIITDFPKGQHNSTPVNDVLPFIASWQFQVADRFDVNHVTIAAQNTCLSGKCDKIIPAHSSITTQDLFFRSGPAGTRLFRRPWPFQTYTPDVLILDLGSIDFSSMSSSQGEDSPSQTPSTLIRAFSTSYANLITSIRKFAYPLHPSALSSYLSDGYIYNSAPSTVPIFVMLPFDAPRLLAHTLQSIVASLRNEGDIATFFLDTSGWLTEPEDFVSDAAGPRKAISVQGNKKAAAFMHIHLCRYLVADGDVEKCPFQRHGEYKGSVFVPREAELEKVVLENKIEKIKTMFGLQAREL